MWRPPVTFEQVFQFLMRYSCEERRVVDLVSIQIEDRQHRAVADRVQILVGVPGGREWSSLCFTIANHNCYQQVGIIKSSSEGVGQAIPQFASFVYGARSFGSAVAADTAWERE